MFARGEFELGSSGALTVPQTAVVVRDGFSYVYRVGADNRVAQLKVQTGRIAG
jgi:HlyD family secretion protein